ncbi:Protein NLRC5 [Holothuria leucospilota]|uniref:Protein NLRC5 n=1 Tax=Holothuria leucospilota TaxID=206669 RepID=A0A9Q1BWP6_HOLLE|nr:Protein NLRC5 [Holothuria leucospilota]
MASKLPTPLHVVQDSRYAKQDGWWLDDISLCSSGNVAVSGHNYRTSQSYVCIYGSTVDNSDSKDRLTFLYHKQFTGKLSWRRYISFITPNSTEIVTCQYDLVQVIDYNRDVVLRSRKVNGRTTCLSVSENQLIIGLQSDIVNIYDNDLNEIKSIRLIGIRDDWPDDIAAADRLYLCTDRYPGRAIVCSQDRGGILTEYTTGQDFSNATSIAVSRELGLAAVLWYLGRTSQEQIIFYLLSENKSFLTLNVESGVSIIRISDKGKIVTGKADTGKVELYNLASLFSYSHLKESLVSRIGRNDCKKLADFFGMGRDELNTVLNSERPTGALLLAFEEKGVIQASNVHRLKQAFLGLKMSPSLCHAVNMYHKFRDQITSYDRFLATLSAHLTSIMPAKLCDFFHVSDEQKDSIISSQNPGLSLLLLLDEMGIIKPSAVGCLEEPFNKFRLVQALAKIDEYKEIVKEENNQLPQTTPHSLKDKRALFVEFLKKKIKIWYETMTPVPWKKSCQWKSTDLFVGSGLILTDSKAKQNVQNIDEQCKLIYTEIFTHEKLKSEIRIILEGDSGAGKTMLSSQLAYDWSEGKINGVDILIFLPLKIVEDKTLIQAVNEFYIPTNTPLSGNDIESILASGTERICLLLDGLEEYSTRGKMRAKESSEVMKIMKKEKYSNCKVVITCRSDFAHDLPEYPMLKLGRFGETERNSYIEKLSPHKQKKIKRIIQDNPFILDLCSVPLLFVLAVHNIERMSVLEEGQLNKVSPFIKSMILTLCPSSTVKHEVDGIWSEFFRSEKMTLGELAFNGLCKGRQQLSWQKDFMETNVDSFKVWVDSGILVLEEGLVITEKENQDISEINKGENINEKTEKEKRKRNPDELPVSSEDMVTAVMSASKTGLETEPHVIKMMKVRRAAGQVPLTVKFLHKVIQEWFAATFFCSMMRSCTSEDQFQHYVCSQLQHISPTDLHYVLRFTSYLHPPSCHVIMKYLLKSYHKDGSLPSYIMNCVFLCFNEHNDVKGPDMRNAVVDVCKGAITIQSEDSRLLQQAKSALLDYASNDGVIIEKLELKDVIFAVDETSLTLNSGVQLGILHTVKLIKVSRWDQVLQKDDYRNILKFLSDGKLLKEVCCIFPSQPPHPLDEITLRKFVSNDIKVKWHIGHFVQSLDPKRNKWEINFKQPGTSSAEIGADQYRAKYEEEMQHPSTSSFPSTSLEPIKYSHTQGTLKRIERSYMNEIAVPEKKAKVALEEPTASDVTQKVPQPGIVSSGERKYDLEKTPVKNTEGRNFKEGAFASVVKKLTFPEVIPGVVGRFDQGQTLAAVLDERFNQEKTLIEDFRQRISQETVTTNIGTPIFFPGETSTGLSVERTITNDGGVLKIADTDVQLVVPAGAFKEGRSECLIRLSIIPPGRHDEASTSFCSNSSTIVELLPNNLTLKLPVQVTLPHCLQLKKDTQKKVKIFMSHHKEDVQPKWEEVFDHRYVLDDKKCTIWMERFCWTKYEIDDEIVEAKKIQIYTAAKPVYVPDDIATVQVGYHLDLPGAGEILRQNPSLIVDQQMPYLFLKEGKHPLKVFLSKIFPNTWTNSTPEDNPQEISFRSVASSVEYLCLFTLQHDINTTKVPTCIFKVSQNENHLTLQIRPKDQPKGTNQAEQQVTKATLITDPIKSLLEELDQSWNLVGRNLGLPGTVLGDIEKNYKKAQEQSYHMLQEWIQRNGSDATHSNLIQALLQANRKDLADAVKDWKDKQNA